MEESLEEGLLPAMGLDGSYSSEYGAGEPCSGGFLPHLFFLRQERRGKRGTSLEFFIPALPQILQNLSPTHTHQPSTSARGLSHTTLTLGFPHSQELPQPPETASTVLIRSHRTGAEAWWKIILYSRHHREITRKPPMVLSVTIMPPLSATLQQVDEADADPEEEQPQSIEVEDALRQPLDVHRHQVDHVPCCAGLSGTTGQNQDLVPLESHAGRMKTQKPGA